MALEAPVISWRRATVGLVLSGLLAGSLGCEPKVDLRDVAQRDVGQRDGSRGDQGSAVDAMASDTAMAPDTAMIPDTAAIPDTAVIPDTPVIPDRAVISDTAVIPDIAAIPDSAVRGCTGPDGVAIASGASGDYYPTPSVATGQSCTRVARSCTNGSLSGPAFATCATCDWTQVTSDQGCTNPPPPAAYPAITSANLKGLYTEEFDPRIAATAAERTALRSELAAHGVKNVQVTLLWPLWEPAHKHAPCGNGEITFDDHCFVVDGSADEAVREWTALGAMLHGGSFWTPEWARYPACSPTVTTHCCPHDTVVTPNFCAARPEVMDDLQRFARLVATRYDGQHGFGRVVDYLTGNEVGCAEWFNPGCPNGTACDKNAWIHLYAQHYIAFYDGVQAANPNTRIFMPWASNFANGWDAARYISFQTFVKGDSANGITGFADRVGTRDWRVVWHPYLHNFNSADWDVFAIEKTGEISWANLGALVGWLYREFPNDPHAWQIQTMEGGLNSMQRSSTESPDPMTDVTQLLERQRTLTCTVFQTALGTPGLERLFFYRMLDHSIETATAMAFGLRDINGAAKPAYDTYLHLDAAGSLQCGFELLPFVRLSHFYNSTNRQHWASTRPPPPGYAYEFSWKLLREPAADTVLLHECLAFSGSATVRNSVITTTMTSECTGALIPMGPLGYAHATGGNGRVAIRRCYIPATFDHYYTTADSCPIGSSDGILGYALPG